MKVKIKQHIPHHHHHLFSHSREFVRKLSPLFAISPPSTEERRLSPASPKVPPSLCLPSHPLCLLSALGCIRSFNFPQCPYYTVLCWVDGGGGGPRKGCRGKEGGVIAYCAFSSCESLFSLSLPGFSPRGKGNSITPPSLVSSSLFSFQPYPLSQGSFRGEGDRFHIKIALLGLK